jgi:hypothetical protein
LRRDRRRHAVARRPHELGRPGRRDVLEHHRQLRVALEQRDQNRVDEMRFPIEHVDVGAGSLAVHQQRHSDFLHAGQRGADFTDVGDARIRVRRRAGRIEFDAVYEARGPGLVDFLRRRAIRQIKRHERLESSAGRQRRHDSSTIGRRLGRGGDGGLEIGHHDGAAEPFGGEFDHRFEHRAVAQMHVPVVGPLNGHSVHEARARRRLAGAPAAVPAAVRCTVGGQPRCSRSSV